MLKFASSLGLAIALADLKRRVRRMVRQGAIAAVAAVFFLLGVCFLLVTLHLWLSRILDPIASAGIIGGSLVLIALILFLAARQAGKSGAQRRAAPEPGPAMRENLAGIQDALGANPSAIASPLVITGLALILGFVLARGRRRD